MLLRDHQFAENVILFLVSTKAQKKDKSEFPQIINRALFDFCYGLNSNILVPSESSTMSQKKIFFIHFFTKLKFVFLMQMNEGNSNCKNHFGAVTLFPQ